MRARLSGILVVAVTALVAHPGSAAGPPSAAALPQPVLGKRINLSPVSGQVSVRLPGRRDFAALDAPRQVPVRTVVDTRRGKVRLVSAGDQPGETQAGRFSGGLFQVRQSDHHAAAGLTVLRLLGGPPRSVCAESGSPSGLRQSLRQARRRLRARVRPGSHYRTRTSGVAATVRGTVWDMTDDCGQVDTQVRRGEVLVENFIKDVRRIVGPRGRFRTRGRYSAATVRGG